MSCGSFIGQPELHALLDGREQRARLQRFVLARSCVKCVCQISLNIPGLPKRMEGEERALLSAERRLAQSVGHEATVSMVLVNGAGMALLLAYSRVAPLDLKKMAVEIEESADWHRVLDIDVITPDGNVSRNELGLPPRRCLICEKEAKACARSGAHSIQDLRKVSSRFLSRSFNSDTSVK